MKHHTLTCSPYKELALHCGSCQQPAQIVLALMCSVCTMEFVFALCEVD